MTMVMSPSGNEARLKLYLRGGNLEAWRAREGEILVEGPRGTGKTRTILELINALCQAYPGLVVLIVRKYQKTLATSVTRTFKEQVVHPGDGVHFFGGNENEPASYRYRNGSRIVLGGMDNPEKVKSSEYDLVYANEATELNEDDWESLKPLLRHQVDGKRLIEHQRLMGDCNPTYNTHWLNQRCERGECRRIRTSLKDNPSYYDDAGRLTDMGSAYLATLTNLSGPKRERWVDGKWTGTENACYPIFDRSVHIRPLEPGLYLQTTIIGEDYGGVHSCGVGALSIDQYNRRWIREAWGEPDRDKGASLNLVVSQFKNRYATKRGRGDPNQKFLNDSHGFATARGGNGGSTGAPRLHRIDLMDRLFYTFPGGRVPTFKDEKNLTIPTGPFEEPDSPGIFLVEGAPGIDRLADQIEAYHFIYTETAKGKTKDVYRVDEDLIAAVECANEEWEEGSVEKVAPGIAVIRGPKPPKPTFYAGGLNRTRGR